MTTPEQNSNPQDPVPREPTSQDPVAQHPDQPPAQWQAPYGQSPSGHGPQGHMPQGQIPANQGVAGSPSGYQSAPGYGGPVPHSGPGPYGAPVPYGPPPGWTPPPRKRQQDAEPGRFMWWDLGGVLIYIAMMVAGGSSLLVFVPAINSMLTSPDPIDFERGLFLINAITYVVLGAVAFALSGSALWRAIKAFSYLWWLKLLLIPVAWFLTIVVNAVLIMALTDDVPETSENQQAIESMLQAAPFLAAVLVIALLGPYVEEYIFRHLLIGKLSRWINVWVCGAISVAIFPLLHFIPALMGLADDLSLVTVIPYVTMGLVFTLAYIISGRNLFYAWLLHAFNNFMSLISAYFLLPWAEDYLERFGELDQMLRLVFGL